MLGIFITAAYPSEEACIQALKILHEEKISLIELGIPFSDPLADGPVIQNASFKALENGINIDKIFEMLVKARLGVQQESNYETIAERASSRLRRTNDRSVLLVHEDHKDDENDEIEVQQQSHYGLNNIIFFTYYNPVYVYGLEKLAKKCAEHGIKGLLIPDLPIEEAETVSQTLKGYGLSLTLLVAITSTEERIERISALSEPFIYLVSRIGVTGSEADVTKWSSSPQQETSEILKQKIREIRKYAPNKPIGLGFGIDTASKVKETLDLGVDIAIIGTKAIRVLEEDSSSDLEGFRSFIRSLSP